MNQQEDYPVDDEFDQSDDAPRRPGLLTWAAGGVVLALVALALIWGATGLGREEPTPMPTATQISIFRATATPTLSAGVALTPTAALPITPTLQTPTPGPVAPPQIRIGGRVRVVGADPEGISVRFGPGKDNQRITTLHDGVELTIMEPPANYNDPYPTTADGFTWWRIRMADGTIGWTAGNWLQPLD